LSGIESSTRSDFLLDKLWAFDDKELGLKRTLGQYSFFASGYWKPQYSLVESIVGGAISHIKKVLSILQIIALFLREISC
jgi:hypothetical protein